MNKTDKLLASINSFIQKAEESEGQKLVETIPDFHKPL